MNSYIWTFNNDSTTVLLWCSQFLLYGFTFFSLLLAKRAHDHYALCTKTFISYKEIELNVKKWEELVKSSDFSLLYSNTKFHVQKYKERKIEKKNFAENKWNFESSNSYHTTII